MFFINRMECNNGMSERVYVLKKTITSSHYKTINKCRKHYFLVIALHRRLRFLSKSMIFYFKVFSVAIFSVYLSNNENELFFYLYKITTIIMKTKRSI